MEYLRPYLPEGVFNVINTCHRYLVGFRSLNHLMSLDVNSLDMNSLQTFAHSVNRADLIPTFLELFGERTDMNEERLKMIEDIKEDIKNLRLTDVLTKVTAMQKKRSAESPIEDNKESSKNDEEKENVKDE